MSDPRWVPVDEMPDNDGHGIRWYQHVSRPWLMLELYPCPNCASACRFVIDRDSAMRLHVLLSALTGAPVFSLN